MKIARRIPGPRGVLKSLREIPDGCAPFAGEPPVVVACLPGLCRSAGTSFGSLVLQFDNGLAALVEEDAVMADLMPGMVMRLYVSRLPWMDLWASGGVVYVTRGGVMFNGPWWWVTS